MQDLCECISSFSNEPKNSLELGEEFRKNAEISD